MPAYQGALDGLCGPYAIVNALELCGLGKDRDTLFQAACSISPSLGWPTPVWLGTSYSDLKRMVRACLSSPANRHGISARYPLTKAAPPTNSRYWERFDEAFSDPRAICGIIGVRQPNQHWVVVLPDGGRIAFVDSCAERPTYRKNRAALFAGFRRPKPSQWLLDRRELIIFRS